MCLYTKQFKFKTAETDITCLKILETVAGEKGDIIVTPFAFVPVPEEILSGKELFIPDDMQMSWLEARMKEAEISLDVEEGVIHSFGMRCFESGAGRFTFARDMLCEIEYHMNSVGYDERYIRESESRRLGCDVHPMIIGISLYRCVIPAGTEYIEGAYSGFGRDFDHNFLSYGSKAIRFVEKLTECRREGDASLYEYRSGKELYDKLLDLNEWTTV